MPVARAIEAIDWPLAPPVAAYSLLPVASIDDGGVTVGEDVLS